MVNTSFSKTDEYGFERGENFDYESYEMFMSKYLKILAIRSKKWDKHLKNNPSLKPSATLKRYIRKGVPCEHRAMVWLTVSGGKLLKEKNPNLFEQLVNQKPAMPEIGDAIRIDLPRTFPNNIYFRDDKQLQEKLYRVLIAFANYNKQIAYCQGLNYIAGLLLLISKNEEVTFYLLLVLIEKILPKNYYTKSMSGLICDINVLEGLVDKRFPAINRLLKDSGLTWPVIVTKWFICVFVEVLPTETVLRIWDCLFYEGNKIIFRVCLSLIKENYQTLVETQPDLALIIQTFKQILASNQLYDCHLVINKMFKENLSRKEIDSLREKFSQNR